MSKKEEKTENKLGKWANWTTENDKKLEYDEFGKYGDVSLGWLNSFLKSPVEIKLYFFKIEGDKYNKDIILKEKGIEEYNSIYKPILEANGVYVKASASLKLSMNLKLKFRIKIISDYNNSNALINEDKLEEVLLTLIKAKV